MADTNMTQEQLDAIAKLKEVGLDVPKFQDTLKDVTQDTEPSLAIDEDGLPATIGETEDVKQTLDTHEYKIVFAEVPKSKMREIPENWYFNEKTQVGTFEKTFKATEITPMISGMLSVSAVTMLSTISHLRNDGSTVQLLSNDEALNASIELGQRGVRSMYELIGTYLNIEESLVPHIQFENMVNIYFKIMENNPTFFQGIN